MKKKKNLKVQISIVLDPEVLQVVDAVAEAQERSRSWMINAILKEGTGMPGALDDSYNEG